jgi:hypothetical protein
MKTFKQFLEATPVAPTSPISTVAPVKSGAASATTQKSQEISRMQAQAALLKKNLDKSLQELTRTGSNIASMLTNTGVNPANFNQQYDLKMQEIRKLFNDALTNMGKPSQATVKPVDPLQALRATTNI